METVTGLVSYTAREHKAEDCLKLANNRSLRQRPVHFKWKFLGGLFNMLPHNSLDMYGAHFMLKSRELGETSVSK